MLKSKMATAIGYTAYKGWGMRGMRLPQHCWNHIWTYVDGFIGVARGVAGVIFGLTSAVSWASKVALLASYWYASQQRHLHPSFAANNTQSAVHAAPLAPVDVC